MAILGLPCSGVHQKEWVIEMNRTLESIGDSLKRIADCMEKVNANYDEIIR